MFNFKMPAMKGSPMSKMGGAQQLQALGAAFSGDQQQLGALMASLGQGGGPVVNNGGEDISAAFGGDLTAAEPDVMKQMMAGLPAMVRGAGRKFGFGGR